MGVHRSDLESGFYRRVERGARIVDRHVADVYCWLEWRVATREYVVDDPLKLYEPAAPRPDHSIWI